MDDSTRRGFLIMAGVGTAAAAGAAVVATNAGAEPAGPAVTVPARASGALVAHVPDVRSGRVSLLVGETEVVVNDPDLVARLARAATGTKA